MTTYCLPLGQVYPNKNLKELTILTAATLDGIGDISMKLTSPEGNIYTSDNPFADETITVYSLAMQQYGFGSNYPLQYLNSGAWTLQVTGKLKSTFKLWWKAN